MGSPGESRADDRDVRLKRLQRDCEMTLDRFLAVATDTCHATSRLRHLPVNKDKRLEIFIQKKKEDAARDAYQKARDALLAVIEADPEFLGGEQANAPARGARKPRVGMHGHNTG